MNHRLLNDCQILVEQGWTRASQQIILGEQDFGYTVQREGQQLADSVVGQELSIRELRGGVAWANAHDREVDQVIGCMDSQNICFEDQLEAVARRLAHHSGRLALDLVGSNRKRDRYIARRRLLGR